MFVFINDVGKPLVTAQRKQTMLTNSKIALSVALVFATASAAAAAPKPAVHHQTATARHLPAASYLRTGSARSGDLVNSANPCYFKIQTIGNEDSDGFTPTDYNCRQLAPGRS
jgi:hypothetical protein